MPLPSPHGAGMQPQSFAHRQPRTPQAERLVAELPPGLRSQSCLRHAHPDDADARDVCRCTKSVLERLSCAAGSGVAPSRACTTSCTEMS